MITTTTNQILGCNPCVSGWMALTGQGTERGYWVGDDEVLTFQSIVERCGWLDAIWALKTVSYGYRDKFLEMNSALYQIQREYIISNKMVHIDKKQKRLAELKSVYDAIVSLPMPSSHLTNLTLVEYIISMVMWIHFHIKHQYMSEVKFRVLELLNNFTGEE